MNDDQQADRPLVNRCCVCCDHLGPAGHLIPCNFHQAAS